MDWLKHAFAIEDPKALDPTEDQRQVVDRLCREIVRRGLTTPTLLFLEMSRPLNFVGAQALHFFQPFLKVFTDSQAPQRLAELLEHRGAVDFICRRLEQLSQPAEEVASHHTEAPEDSATFTPEERQ